MRSTSPRRLRSCAIRSRTRRRSTSSCVSPGPRVPTPPPPGARGASTGAVSRGSRYWSCASSTCSLPSRLRARCAKMSRMSALRSMTLRLSALLEVALLRRRELVVEDDDVGRRLVGQRAHLLDLALADEGGRVDAAERLDVLADDRDAGGVGEAAAARRATPRPGGAHVGPLGARPGPRAPARRRSSVGGRSPKRHHPGTENALDSIDDLRRSPQPGACRAAPAPSRCRRGGRGAGRRRTGPGWAARIA